MEHNLTIYDFKLNIKAKKVPVNIDNEIISYIQDSTLKSPHLICELFFQDTLIAQGIVLDFYKEFEILQFNENFFTQIKTFEWNGTTYTKNSYFGQKIFEIKNFKKPPLPTETKDSYINEIVSILTGYVKYLKERHSNIQLTYIPSHSKIPEEITSKLSVVNSVDMQNIVSKNSVPQSKSIKTLSLQTLNKYKIDLEQNNNNPYILIDDVIGTGSSLCEVMQTLHQHNHKINYFLIPVKDVKR